MSQENWCDECANRLPFDLTRAVNVAWRRNQNAYQRAVHEARQWLKTHPHQPPAVLAEQLQDMADMLAGIGRHAGHSRREDNGAVVCCCGVTVTSRSQP